MLTSSASQPPQVYKPHWEILAWLFTFGRDVNKHRVTKVSKGFTSKHLAADSNLIIHICLESVQSTIGAFHQVSLSRGEDNDCLKQSCPSVGASFLRGGWYPPPATAQRPPSDTGPHIAAVTIPSPRQLTLAASSLTWCQNKCLSHSGWAESTSAPAEGLVELQQRRETRGGFLSWKTPNVPWVGGKTRTSVQQHGSTLQLQYCSPNTTAAILQWQYRGCNTMATILWLQYYSYITMATTLQRQYYGYNSMATILWWQYHGNNTMVTILWRQYYGHNTMGTIVWR